MRKFCEHAPMCGGAKPHDSRDCEPCRVNKEAKCIPDEIPMSEDEINRLLATFFDILLTSHNHERLKTRSSHEIAEWAITQLHKQGFETYSVGSTWAKIEGVRRE